MHVRVNPDAVEIREIPLMHLLRRWKRERVLILELVVCNSNCSEGHEEEEAAKRKRRFLFAFLFWLVHECSLTPP